MKSKPDVTRFTGLAKDPTAFLEGATDEPKTPHAQSPESSDTSRGQRETRQVTLAVAKPEPTVAKMFRLRWDVAAGLKFAAAQETLNSGRRVTETEIVERLLVKYLKM